MIGYVAGDFFKTHLRTIPQNWSFPQVEVKLKKKWNCYHLDMIGLVVEQPFAYFFGGEEVTTLAFAAKKILIILPKT